MPPTSRPSTARASAPAEIAITTGCNQAFFVAMLSLARAGDNVVLPSPWYFNHKMTLDMLGVEAARCPARPRLVSCRTSRPPSG